MKILWISFWGSWTKPLLWRLSEQHHLGIIIPVPNGKDHFDIIEGVEIYNLGVDHPSLFRSMDKKLFLKFESVIEKFKPDIIHIHGTEKNLGQIQNFITDIPVVISIQGLMTGYKRYTLNFLTTNDFKKYSSIKNRLGWGGANQMSRLFNHGAQYENDILNNGKYFIGRTNWDRAYILFRNPQANYFHGEELLRDEFYNHSMSWSIDKCIQHSIFMPSGFNPIKGLHWAIETVALLKAFFPDIKLIVPGIPLHILKGSRLRHLLLGENYMMYCLHKIKEYGLVGNIKLLGNLNALQMVQQMQLAHVFLSPSSIDNSPNAVGEATFIGTPVVTTPVGGVPSILSDGESCLFAPSGDAFLMAYQIKRIFDDPGLASKLSKNAFKVAKRRHDIKSTTNQYANIYNEVITLHKNLLK